MATNDDDPSTRPSGSAGFPLAGHVHDSWAEIERQDNLILLAVGEPVSPDFARHQAGCAQCQRELAIFVDTVRLGREAGARRDYADAHPPASIWAGIASELAGELGSSPAAELAPTRPGLAPARPSPFADVSTVSGSGANAGAGTGFRPARRGWTARPSRRTRVGLVAAGIVLALVGAVGGYLAGHSTRGTSTHIASNARLTTVPGGPRSVVGTAAVRSGADGQQVVVSTTGLPLRDGFYEVWLFDPDRGPAGDMVAVGTLGTRGRGAFTLPGGIDIRAYHVVDVSAQSYGGGSRIVHAQSVLQGSLTQ